MIQLILFFIQMLITFELVFYIILYSRSNACHLDIIITHKPRGRIVATWQQCLRMGKIYCRKKTLKIHTTLRICFNSAGWYRQKVIVLQFRQIFVPPHPKIFVSLLLSPVPSLPSIKIENVSNCYFKMLIYK